jgi:hypothetical protein
VPALQSIGRSLARTARERVEDSLPLARALWDSTGREGRVVAAIALGAKELVGPETIIPLLRELARTCVTWEDANRLAMDALEPIVRKDPQRWLPSIEPRLSDASPRTRRAVESAVETLRKASGKRCVGPGT